MDQITVKPKSSYGPTEWPLHPADDRESFDWFLYRAPMDRTVLQVYVSALARNRILTHGRETRDREVFGVLIGEYVRHGEGRFVFIDGTVRGDDASGTASSVAMSPAAWGKLDAERDRLYPGAVTVGWYHTHPGWGIFLSGHDRTLHGTFFKREFDVALVFDLGRKDAETDGAFVWADGKLIPEKGLPFGIFQPGRGFYRRLPRLAMNEKLLDAKEGRQ